MGRLRTEEGGERGIARAWPGCGGCAAAALKLVHWITADQRRRAVGAAARPTTTADHHDHHGWWW